MTSGLQQMTARAIMATLIVTNVLQTYAHTDTIIGSGTSGSSVSTDASAHNDGHAPCVAASQQCPSCTISSLLLTDLTQQDHSTPVCSRYLAEKPCDPASPLTVDLLHSGKRGPPRSSI